MNDEFTLTLNSPITEEQWDAITDVDFEHTNEITFHTKHGKEVKFVKKSAQPKPQWIPCSERLPEQNGDYLCSLGNDAHSIEVDTFTDDHFEIYNVIAWMPLPAVYKGEQK